MKIQTGNWSKRARLIKLNLTPRDKESLRPLSKLGGVAVVFLLAACAPVPEQANFPQIALKQVSFDDLRGFSDDRLVQAVPALAHSCRKINTGQAQSKWAKLRHSLPARAADWRAACAAFVQRPPGDETALRQWITGHFVPYAVTSNGTHDGVFTGYFEVTLNGSYHQSDRYRYPLYPVPDDLVKTPQIGRIVDGRLVPYFDRQAIDAGAVTTAPLLWADDPVDVFFLHIQGSGRVNLPDGQTTRVGWAASNGRAFRGIGRILIDGGYLPPEQAAMHQVRHWLRTHPDKARTLMQGNKRFIFFREIADDGPLGALSVPLTPGRSLAVDPAFIPLGAPLWLETTFPATAARAHEPLRRLMVAQDTGTAITGPLRGDFYWGSGEDALTIAGGMKQQGRYFLLLPKTKKQ